MPVKLKEQLKIHVYFSNYLEWSLIWSDGNMFAGRAKNTYFDCSNNCGDFCHCELVKFILTILKRNILQLKLWANANAYAQMYFAAKLAFNLSNENRPLQRALPWIFGKWFMKTSKKNIHFTTNISIYTGYRHFKVLWGFILHIL